jgi:hypothetical protein
MFWLLSAFVLAGIALLLASIAVNAQLVATLQREEPETYKKLGKPRLVGYGWVGAWRNAAYSNWLREQRLADNSPYSSLARRLQVLHLAFLLAWLLLVVFALLPTS